MDDPFVAGVTSPAGIPLERFLPPLQPGMVLSWIKPRVAKGDWILDPFGNHPMHAIELANAGYRVLVCANNPIHAFMLEMLAASPNNDDFQNALQALASAIVFNEEKAEDFFQSFYHVPCAKCGKTLTASRFLWRRSEEQPFGFSGVCLACGSSGDQNLSYDAALALRKVPNIQYYRARAIENVAGIEDPLRSEVETSLQYYPERPLVLLQLLMRKVEGLTITDSQKKLIRALILSVLDQVNTLWAYPTSRSRPRQLVIPAVFQEVNIWNTLYSSISQWVRGQKPVALRKWDELPPLSGGISLYKGRVRELSNLFNVEMIQAVSAILPRPNQAFWTLSALWAGWLWGRDAALSLKNILGRQRYDWNWHSNALSSTFEAIGKLLADERKPIHMLILENEHEFLTAAFCAGDQAGFENFSCTLSGDREVAQLIWKAKIGRRIVGQFDRREEKIREAVRKILTWRGEPTSYQFLHAAALNRLHEDGILQISNNDENELLIYEVTKAINSVLSDENFIERFGGGPVSVDTGMYWLKDVLPPLMPLTDKVELEVYKYLNDHIDVEFKDIRAAVYQACPGLMTPEDEVISTCIQAYANAVDDEGKVWRLREGESESARNEDVHQLIKDLEIICSKIKCTMKVWKPEKREIETLGIKNSENILHRNYVSQLIEGFIVSLINKANKEQEYKFYIVTDAVISRFAYDQFTKKDKRRVFVYPGSRANLLAFKLRRDAHLAAALGDNWRFVKYRQLRTIAEHPLLTWEFFEELLKEDPPEFEAAQLALF